MTDEHVSDRIVTIPNVISFIRLLGVPVFWWLLFVRDNVGLAALLVFVIGWTDWIDGYLARRLNQVSKLGKALDPLADRLLIGSAIVGGLIAGIVPALIGIPLMAREVVMAIVALTLVSKGAGTLTVRYMGKVATFVLYGAIPGFYLAETGFVPEVITPFSWFFGVIGLVLYVYVAIFYIGDARRALAAVESPTDAQES